MKTIKQYWKQIFFSWFIFLPVTALLIVNRQWSWIFALLLPLLTYFLMMMVFVSQNLPKKLRLTNALIICSPLIFLLLFYLWRGPDSYLTTLHYLFSPVIGIGFGCGFFFFQKLYSKIFILAMMLGFCFWLPLSGFPLWMDYFTYRSWTGNTFESIPDFQLTSYEPTSYEKSIGKEVFKGNYVVLEFWNTSCGRCFASFPDFELLAEKYENSDFKFYAVNVPLKTDTIGEAFSALRKEGYKFENLLGYNPESTYKIFKVSVFPTALVLDKSGNVIYRGNPRRLGKIISKLINY